MSLEQTIYNYAFRFRNAIEKAIKDNRFNWRDRFSGFPSGCCDDASDLLAYYLEREGINTIQVNGVYRDENPMNKTNHVWLRIENGLIIDITGDQFRHNPLFSYYNEGVYVGKEDWFHGLFLDRKEQPSFSFELNETDGEKRMWNLYSIIYEYL